MSCLQIALNRLGIKYDNYYASEIDKYATQVTQHNYPNTVQLGDITKWEDWDLPYIDLIAGGSPCQGFSVAGKRLNFDDPRSKLYFVFEDIVKHYKPDYWLLENVVMLQEHQDIISQRLGIKPIKINSALVSAQNRERLYWTNIEKEYDLFGFPYCNIQQPKDKGVMLQDIMIDCSKLNHTDISDIYRQKTIGGVRLNHKKIENRQNYPTSANIYSYKNKCGTLNKTFPRILCNCKPNTMRNIEPIEGERLQTVSDNCTQVENVSNTQRRLMLGNGMTIDIICHILSHM